MERYISLWISVTLHKWNETRWYMVCQMMRIVRSICICICSGNGLSILLSKPECMQDNDLGRVCGHIKVFWTLLFPHQWKICTEGSRASIMMLYRFRTDHCYVRPVYLERYIRWGGVGNLPETNAIRRLNWLLEGWTRCRDAPGAHFSTKLQLWAK